jgi:hypothetical protein
MVQRQPVPAFGETGRFDPAFMPHGQQFFKSRFKRDARAATPFLTEKALAQAQQALARTAHKQTQPAALQQILVDQV